MEAPIRKIAKNCLENEFKKPLQPKAEIPDAKIWDFVSDKYQVLAQIGEGQYGQVVKARQRSNNKIVAIKLQKNAF